MRLVFWGISAVSLIAFASNAIAQSGEDEILVLEPSSSWNVDFAEDSCALARTFGTDANAVYADFRQFSPGSDFEISLMGPLLGNHEGKLKYKFVPSDMASEPKSYIRATFGGEHPGIVFSAGLIPAKVDTDTVDGRAEGQVNTQIEWAETQLHMREAEITGFEFSTEAGSALRLNTGSLHDAMNVMRQCTTDLVESWGLKPDSSGNYPPQARPKDLDRWAEKLQQRYPNDALRRDQSGLVRVRLMVDIDGKPSSCHAQIPSEAKTFEDTACNELMRYARFEPVLNSSGQPVPSYYVTKVTYITR